MCGWRSDKVIGASGGSWVVGSDILDGKRGRVFGHKQESVLAAVGRPTVTRVQSTRTSRAVDYRAPA